MFLNLMRLVLLAATMFVVTSCATRIGDFTIVSTKNYEASQKYHLVGRKSGEDLVFMLIIPFGVPNMKDAADRAIEAGNGVYLTNAVVESLSRVLFIGYRVTGDVYAPVSVGAATKPGEKLYRLNREGGKPYLENGLERIAVSN